MYVENLLYVSVLSAALPPRTLLLTQLEGTGALFYGSSSSPGSAVLGEQTRGGHDPALPLPCFYGMAVGGLTELPLVLLQRRLFMPYSQWMEELVSRADFTGYSDMVYHCKPRIGDGDVITIYDKLILTD